MAERDMSNTYRHMNLFDLQSLRSRKLQEIARLEKKFGYLDMQDLRRARFNLKQLDAEIACKTAQLPLFE